MDGRERPQDSVCPMCSQMKHPLNLLCFTCHASTNVAPLVGDGFQTTTSGQVWRKKSAPQHITPAQNGPSPTAPEQTTPSSALGVVEPVAGAKTNLTSSAAAKQQWQATGRRLKEKKFLGLKSSKQQTLVQQALVADSQREQGEADAAREQAADVQVETAPAVNLPKLQVPLGMPKDLLGRLRKELVGVELDEVVDTKPSPIKRMYEKYCALMLVAGKTVVIGRESVPGCHLRHHIQSSDDVGVDADCDCDLGVFCQACGKADRYILVDTIDRFGAQDVADFLLSSLKPEVYSVQYEYRASRGGHHAAPGGKPEIQWERFSGGLLVEDHQHVGRYVKDPADWTTTGACDVGKMTLCWNVVSSVGDCRVLRFHLVETKLAAYVEKDPLSDSYYGDTTPDKAGLSDPRAVELQSVLGPITQMYSAGDMFYCAVDAKQILVPKQGVGHIALWAAGKPRDVRTYSDAFVQARQWLKTTRLTTMECADCIPYMVAFGLLRTVGTENKAVGVLNEHCHEIAEHNESLNEPFAPPVGRVWKQGRRWLVDNQRWVKPLAALTASGAAVAVGLVSKGRIVAAIHGWYNLWHKMLAPKPTFYSLCKAVVVEGNAADKLLAAQALWGKVKMLRATRNMPFFSVLMSAMGLGKLAMAIKAVTLAHSWFGFWTKRRPVEYFHPATSPWWFAGLLLVFVLVRCFKRAPKQVVVGPLQAYCARGRELKEMRQGAKCRIRHVDVPAWAENADMVDCAVVEGPFHIGLGVTGHVPVIAKHCVHNDLVAVRNRGICKRAVARPGWWRTVGKSRMFSLFGHLGPIIPTPYDDWVARYPGSKQRQLRAALGNVVTDYYSAVRRKAFTKMECAEKRTDIGEDEPYGVIAGYDPRLIQGCHAEYVNGTGQFAHAYSKACKGEHGHTTYGPGLNAEALDVWLEMAESFFNEPVAYMDSDAVRLDASVDVECIQTTTELYGELGADEEAMRLFDADQVTHGNTSHGVMYSVPGTVPSGKTTTTCGNTTAVITVVEEALDVIPHKAIVAGDDAAILVPLRLAKDAREALLATGRDAGFEFKVKASRIRCDMEFCSGRWWPAATRTGFAFGPKPGKLLPKLFFAGSRNSVGSRTYGYCQAICIGMLPTVSHLPVAYEFVQQVSRITYGCRMHKEMHKRLVNRDLQNVRRSHPVQPSPEIWEAYAHVYGVSQGECQQAIRRIEQIEILPNMVEHHIFDAMVRQDAPAEGDPDDRDPGVFSCASIPLVRFGLRWLRFGLKWLTPAIEEAARSYYPLPVTMVIMFMEATYLRSKGRSLLYYVPAACIHLGACLLHTFGYQRTAHLLHYLGNLMITLINRRRGRLARGNLFPVLLKGASRPQSLTISMQQVALPQRMRNQRQKGASFNIPPPPPRPATYFPRAPIFNNRRQGQRRGKGRRRRGRDRYTPNPNGVGILGAPGPTGYQGKTKGTIVEGDEFIKSVSRDNGENFTADTLAINPGLAHVFPILCNQARIYEKYDFEKLEFYWVPKVTEFACGTGQSGFMIDYDSKDPPPSTLRLILNNDPHTEAMPYMQYGINCEPASLRDGAKRMKYVRTTDILPTGGDLKTYDGGVCYFGFQGTPNSLGSSEIGELHVRYRCRLHKQQVEFDQGNDLSAVRNYAYSNMTTSMSDTGHGLADQDADWANLEALHWYWDVGADPQPTAAGQIDPYHPDEIPQIAFGNFVNDAASFTPPPGRYFFFINMNVDAIGTKNLDYFRFRLIAQGSPDAPDNQVPDWQPFAIITSHTVGENYRVKGASLTWGAGLPGSRQYTLQYQMSTEDDVGALLYATATLMAL